MTWWGQTIQDFTPEEQARLRAATFGNALAGLSQIQGRNGLEIFAQILGGALAGRGQGFQDVQQSRRQEKQDKFLEARLGIEQQQFQAEQEKLKRQQAGQQQLETALSRLPPEQAERLRLIAAYDPGKAAEFLAGPKQAEPKVVGNALVDPTTGQPIYVAPEPGLSPYQQAQIAIDQQRLALERQRLDKPDVRNPISVQDPNEPGKSILVDPVTLQPVTMGGQPLRPADTREQSGPKVEADLRKEFNGLPEVQGYKAVIPAVRSAIESFGKNDRASDIDLVFAVGKTLDPTSVVREGEQVTIARTGGIFDQLQGYLNSLNGGALLTPDTRRGLLGILKSRASALSESALQRQREYEGYAIAYGLEPGRAVGRLDTLPDFSGIVPATPGAPATPATAPTAAPNPRLGF